MQISNITTSPRVSILVPVYNSASTLARCLDSASAQSLTDIEILVADDASTDDSVRVAEAAAAADARIHVLRLPTNIGKPAAMNVMMAKARGIWVAVLDADDAYAPDRLTTLTQAAERAGVDMVADNLFYVDSGLPHAGGGFGTVLRAAFAADAADRIIGRADLVRDADNFGDFDYGILKPVIRRAFVQAHGLAYHEGSRLAEDFTYLLDYMMAGGRTLVCAQPMYIWTMPFGTVSRQWTRTGAGAWRYDYRGALAANAVYIAKMRALGADDVVAMLERRGRQYRAMMHYITAQRMAADGRPGAALFAVARHPSIWTLLARRVAGRARRSLRPAALTPA